MRQTIGVSRGAKSSLRAFLSGERPLAFAHRGGSLLWPENTLLAFEGALKAGCRYLETDLHTTRDGVIMVFHDPKLDRTTNGTGLLKRLSLRELKRLDAGYHFTLDGKTFPYRGKGLTIPTFEELLELDAGARFNVEIKQSDPPMVGAALALDREPRSARSAAGRGQPRRAGAGVSPRVSGCGRDVGGQQRKRGCSGRRPGSASPVSFPRRTTRFRCRPAPDR